MISGPLRPPRATPYSFPPPPLPARRPPQCTDSEGAPHRMLVKSGNDDMRQASQALCACALPRPLVDWLAWIAARRSARAPLVLQPLAICRHSSQPAVLAAKRCISKPVVCLLPSFPTIA